MLQNGVTTQVDYPDKSEVDTLLGGINDKGEVSGDWDDGGTDSYGFRLDLQTGTFTPIKIKGSSFVQVWGVNNAGLIAIDDANAGVGYIYCPHKPAQCPGGMSKIEISDEKSITVKGGRWLHYAGQRDARPSGIHLQLTRPPVLAVHP